MKKAIIAAVISMASFGAVASETFSMECESRSESMSIHFNDTVMVADHVMFTRDKAYAEEEGDSYIYSRRNPAGKLINFVVLTPSTEDIYIVTVESKPDTFKCTFK